MKGGTGKFFLMFSEAEVRAIEIACKRLSDDAAVYIDQGVETPARAQKLQRAADRVIAKLTAARHLLAGRRS